MGGSTPAATDSRRARSQSLALLPEVSVAANSLALLDEQGRVINNTEVGSLPDGVVEAEGFLWVANTADDEVTRIDAATFSSIDTIAVGAGSDVDHVGVWSLWVANSGDRTVSRLNCLDG